MAKKICVIGAAIMDIMGFPSGEIQGYDSVPGKIELAPGGVGRNIAENLALLSVPVNLITAFGDDPFSEIMIRRAKALNLDISNSLFLNGRKAAMHLAAMDHFNDMAVGIADLDLFNLLNPTNLKRLLPSIDQAEFCILETNLPKETIHWLLDHCSNTRFVLDPVSTTMAQKVKGGLDKIEVICPNIKEAESIIGQKINSEESIKEAGKWFMSNGLKQIFITLGKKGVYYQNEEESGWIPALPVKVINTMGAGDAFTAGLIYALQKKRSIADCARMGVACAHISLCHVGPVHPETSEDWLIEKFQALKGGK